MRGHAIQHAWMFSALSPEERVPVPHPLGPIRQYVDRARIAVSPPQTTLYAHTGRPSITPEKLRRALLREVRYSLRRERLVREELEYNLWFRWCAGLDWDAPVWEVTVFTTNRDRVRAGTVATAFFAQMLAQATAHRLLSDEPFTVDCPLLEAWAGPKRFKLKSDDPHQFVQDLRALQITPLWPSTRRTGPVRLMAGPRDTPATRSVNRSANGPRSCSAG
jgi:transposase